jgi:hypothetical protein
VKTVLSNMFLKAIGVPVGTPLTFEEDRRCLVDRPASQRHVSTGVCPE